MMRSESHESCQNDVDIVKCISSDFSHHPQVAAEETYDASLVLQPFSDLSRNDHTLDSGQIVASRREGQVELEQVEVIIFPELLRIHL